MNSKRKEQYMAPAIEVIEMEAEGSVMSASGNLPDVDPGGNGMKTNRSRSRHNAASSSDLEDMINDILTVDQ